MPTIPAGVAQAISESEMGCGDGHSQVGRGLQEEREGDELGEKLVLGFCTEVVLGLVPALHRRQRGGGTPAAVVTTVRVASENTTSSVACSRTPSASARRLGPSSGSWTWPLLVLSHPAV